MKTITVKELKNAIHELPDSMPVLLIDLCTDDDSECVYDVSLKSIGVDDVVSKSGKDTKAFTISFNNRLSNN